MTRGHERERNIKWKKVEVEVFFSVFLWKSPRGRPISSVKEKRVPTSSLIHHLSLISLFELVLSHIFITRRCARRAVRNDEKWNNVISSSLVGFFHIFFDSCVDLSDTSCSIGLRCSMGNAQQFLYLSFCDLCDTKADLLRFSGEMWMKITCDDESWSIVYSHTIVLCVWLGFHFLTTFCLCADKTL